MLEFICNACGNYSTGSAGTCPHCHTALIFSGIEKNITDVIQSDCLIHRYQGSDLLEPAKLIKAGKSNMKVAVKLKDMAKPLTVPKTEVFFLDESILSSVNQLRDERKILMKDYDERIASQWQQLQPYTPDHLH